eukprot:353316-Chlamydomonas_euryale.AAC.3
MPGLFSIGCSPHCDVERLRLGRNRKVPDERAWKDVEDSGSRLRKSPKGLRSYWERAPALEGSMENRRKLLDSCSKIHSSNSCVTGTLQESSECGSMKRTGLHREDAWPFLSSCTLESCNVRQKLRTLIPSGKDQVGNGADPGHEQTGTGWGPGGQRG